MQAHASDQDTGSAGESWYRAPVLRDWRREAERFAPSLDVHVHYGPGCLARPNAAT